MDVLRRNDDIPKVMLYVGKLIHKFSLMMVINEGDGAGDLLPPLPLFFYQYLADQIPEGFGTAGVVFSLDKKIELLQKILI